MAWASVQEPRYLRNQFLWMMCALWFKNSGWSLHVSIITGRKEKRQKINSDGSQ